MINNNFLPIILILAGVFGGYFYYSNASNEIFINPPLGGKMDDLGELASLSLDFSNLEIEKLDALKIFGEYPVSPGTTGKRNIFKPF